MKMLISNLTIVFIPSQILMHELPRPSPYLTPVAPLPSAFVQPKPLLLLVVTAPFPDRAKQNQLLP
ncbi:hypothetical protein PAECIP111893_04931 [Paenibacillus plantiphilus]|uniref:Uncharacterized protein n=1 Tax=Paenibacillus plantiphilus TaxID=2905650 RepID=A0ABM9CT45_9BACL|nr:hypothetical protein PAECIP111893_04931 [Paenibacillus plantiphilus]